MCAEFGNTPKPAPQTACDASATYARVPTLDLASQKALYAILLCETLRSNSCFHFVGAQ